MPTETHPQAPADSAEAVAQRGPRPMRMIPTLLARLRLLLGAGLAGAIAAGGIALLLPNTYTATAVLLPPQKEQSAAAMLAGQLGPFAAAAGTQFGLKSPTDLYLGLLGSRTIEDQVIARFGLKGLYRAHTDTDARNRLRRHVRFRSGRDSLIRIEVQDVDPTRAARIANAFVSELEQQNKRLAVTEASQRRRFLEEQVQQSRAALAAAEDALKATQLKTGMIEVSGQTHLAIASIAQLRAQITAAEVALARMRTGATAANPTVIQAESELGAMRVQLAKLENSPADGGPLVAPSAIPEAGLGYLRRLRDLRYHEFLVELLSRQYEAARIDESKAAPAFQVVDPAIPPDKKSGPPRVLLTISGWFATTAAAALCVLGGREFRRLREDFLAA